MSLPNSRILIHQPSAGFEGQSTDIEIHAREILKTREQLNKIYAERTGQPIEKIRADMERDFFMDPEESKAYGLIDQVLTTAGLTDTFRVTLSTEEVPRGKPAPDVYLEAARRLEVDPELLRTAGVAVDRTTGARVSAAPAPWPGLRCRAAAASQSWLASSATATAFSKVSSR